ncbi:MAG: M50 family metallopeptidase [Gemmataceae bacterium]
MGLVENSLAPPTRFDLNFRVGDIPVRVHPFFWLTTVLLGLNIFQEGNPASKAFPEFGIWVVIVFVSILVHELGHVLMGRYFGSRGHIILTGFCGLAVGSAEQRQRWQRILVSLAGPGAGFLFAGLITGGICVYSPSFALYLLASLIHVPVAFPDAVPSPLVVFTLYTALWLNIFWGLVNLLPIWPLDGGQVSREICEAYKGRDGQRLSLWISLFTAAGFAVVALIEVVMKKPLVPYLSFGTSLFAALFFALLALSNWQLLRFLQRAGSEWEEHNEPRAPWEQDPDWWKRGGDPWD